MFEFVHKFMIFMDQGGGVLWAIMALSLLMWMLILERYLYYYRVLPGLRIRMHDDCTRQLQRCSFEQRGKYLVRRIKEACTLNYAGCVQRYLQPIQVLNAALPLLGLLGTVSGMIKTFEAMTLFGSGNVRAMASGISQALFTTMAGLVTALSGVYFSAHLDSRAQLEIQRFKHSLQNDA